MKSANLTRAPRPADPALTPPPPAPAVKRTRRSVPTSKPALTPAPVVAPAVTDSTAGPRLGRPPGNRQQKTLYLDRDLYAAVDARYLAWRGEGRATLAVVMDEILRHALAHWDEIAAAAETAVSSGKPR